MKNISDFQTTTTNDAGEKVKSSRQKISEILNGASTEINTGALDFAGINEKELPTLQKKIEDFAKAIEDKIEGIKSDANMTEALQGDAAEAVKGLVDGTKALLKAYASNLKQEAKEAGEIFAAYKQGTTDIQQDTKSGADEIRRNAQSVNFN